MHGTLYEYGEQLGSIFARLAAVDGELDEQLEAELDAAVGDFDTKAERVALFIQELSGDAERVEAEAERLKARAKALRGREAWLKRYLLSAMVRAERPRVKGELITPAVQASNPSARCTLPADQLAKRLPAAFRRLVPARWEFNAQAALQVHKEGGKLPSGVEVSRGQHLRFY